MSEVKRVWYGNPNDCPTGWELEEPVVPEEELPTGKVHKYNGIWAEYDRRAREEAEWDSTPVGPYIEETDRVVKTSGAQESWETGAVRDSQEGKSRYDLLDPTFLKRVAEVMTTGAEHYGEFNWTRGIPSQRYAASLLRHVYAYLSGDRSEDHLGAACFNLMGLARNEGTDLDDLFEW